MEAITSSLGLTQLYDGLERDAFVIRQTSALQRLLPWRSFTQGAVKLGPPPLSVNADD